MLEIISNVGAIGFFFASIIFIFRFIRHKSKKNISIVLGLMLLLGLIGSIENMSILIIIDGLLILVSSIVMLLYSLIKRRPKKIWIKAVLVSFLLITIGSVITTTFESESTNGKQTLVAESIAKEVDPAIKEIDKEAITQTPTEIEEFTEPVVKDEVVNELSTFEVDFLDVGQGDSELIICDSHAMLIDGGDASNSQFIYAYLEKLGIKELDIIIATHAHEDHVGGLSAALNEAKVDIVLSPVKSYDSETFTDFVKYVEKQNIEITVPKEGDVYQLGSSTVNILGLLPDTESPNNTSIICRVDYYDTSFLFAGDAEYKGEHNVLNNGSDLKADVLKVAHHGSDTSTMYSFLDAVLPKYAVIEVGANNSYGHPDSKVLQILEQAESEVYRTDLNGTVIMKSDGKNITVSTEKNLTIEDITPKAEVVQSSSQNSSETVIVKDTKVSEQVIATPQVTQDTSYHYIGNTNTKKFHTLDCSYLPDEKNRKYFVTRQEAIDQGYVPCKRCDP